MKRLIKQKQNKKIKSIKKLAFEPAKFELKFSK